MYSQLRVIFLPGGKRRGTRRFGHRLFVLSAWIRSNVGCNEAVTDETDVGSACVCAVSVLF